MCSAVHTQHPDINRIVVVLTKGDSTSSLKPKKYSIQGRYLITPKRVLFTWLHLKCNSTCITQGTRLKRQFLCIKCKKKKQNRQAGTSWLQPSIWCSDLPLLSHSDQMLCYWISKAHGELLFRERRELPTWHPNLGGCCLPGNSYSKWTCTSRGEENSIIIWSSNQQKFMVSVPWSGFI